MLETDLTQITSKDLEENNIFKIKDLYHKKNNPIKTCTNDQCNNLNCKIELEKLNKRVIYLTSILLKSQEK